MFVLTILVLRDTQRAKLATILIEVFTPSSSIRGTYGVIIRAGMMIGGKKLGIKKDVEQIR